MANVDREKIIKNAFPATVESKTTILRRSSRIRLSNAIPITCLDYGRDRKTFSPNVSFVGDVIIEKCLL